MGRGAVGCTTSRRSHVRFPTESKYSFLSFQSHYGPGVYSASNRNWYQENLLEGKDSRCVEPTALPLSCAECLEILRASTSWTPKGLSRSVQGLISLTNVAKSGVARQLAARAPTAYLRNLRNGLSAIRESPLSALRKKKIKGLSYTDLPENRNFPTTSSENLQRRISKCPTFEVPVLRHTRGIRCFLQNA